MQLLMKAYNPLFADTEADVSHGSGRRHKEQKTEVLQSA